MGWGKRKRGDIRKKEGNEIGRKGVDREVEHHSPDRKRRKSTRCNPYFLKRKRTKRQNGKKDQGRREKNQKGSTLGRGDKD